MPPLMVSFGAINRRFHGWTQPMSPIDTLTGHASSGSDGRRLLSYFLTILVAYVVVLLLVRTFESRLIFFPNYPDRLEGD
jgi:hypothetical protein